MKMSGSIVVLALTIGVFAAVARAQPPETDSPDIDKQLLDDLPPVVPMNGAAGEDLGSPGEDPIMRILDQMEASRQQLQNGDTSQATVQLQRRIADDLAALIAKMRRQHPQPTGNQSQAATTANPTVNTGNPMEREPGDGDLASDQAPPEAPVGRSIWGHLPKRV